MGILNKSVTGINVTFLGILISALKEVKRDRALSSKGELCFEDANGEVGDLVGGGDTPIAALIMIPAAMGLGSVFLPFQGISGSAVWRSGNDPQMSDVD